jgi:aerobic-type carbon monoxide dehydrogenase small subunit (CoxS/CutS family)
MPDFLNPDSSLEVQQRVGFLTINGMLRTVEAEAQRNLLSVLRDDLELTGTKYGCGEAQCGACVILLDGQPVPACVTSVAAAQGKAITTIEGLAQGERLHPVQQAFIDAGAIQCGYCTPGMIVEAVALLESNSQPNDAQIVEAMDRHICRCGAYARILTAIKAAANKMQGTQL